MIHPWQFGTKSTHHYCEAPYHQSNDAAPQNAGGNNTTLKGANQVASPCGQDKQVSAQTTRDENCNTYNKFSKYLHSKLFTYQTGSKLAS